jgi:hypothetical protein
MLHPCCLHIYYLAVGGLMPGELAEAGALAPPPRGAFAVVAGGAEVVVLSREFTVPVELLIFPELLSPMHPAEKAATASKTTSAKFLRIS